MMTFANSGELPYRVEFMLGFQVPCYSYHYSVSQHQASHRTTQKVGECLRWQVCYCLSGINFPPQHTALQFSETDQIWYQQPPVQTLKNYPTG